MASNLDISTTGNAVPEELEMAVLNKGKGRLLEVSTSDDAVSQTLETKVQDPKGKRPERRVSLSIAINQVASTSSSSRQGNNAHRQSRPALNDRVPAIGVSKTNLRPPPPIIPVPKPPIPWHPKLTPFRLLNLVLPISISTAKAITSLRGNSTAPTTLELISGVVVFLVLFHAGYYESQVKPPHYLRWVFETDCLEYLWRLFEFCSIPRPHYRSTEESDFVVVLTSYHLLVTQTVIFFGLIKAVLTANQYTVAAVWVEWVLAAVVTSCLYIAGLYEYGSVEIWPSFYQEAEDHKIISSIRIFRWKTGVPLVATAVFQSVNTFFIGLGSYMVIETLGPVLKWEHLTLEERAPYAIQEIISSSDPHGRAIYRPGSRPDLYAAMTGASIGLLLISFGLLYGIAVNFGHEVPLRFLRRMVVKIMLHVWGIVTSVVWFVIVGITLHRAWSALGDEKPVIYLIVLIFLAIMVSVIFIGLLFVSVRKTARDIGIGILRLVFPRVFRRMNYAFEEIDTLFQNAEPL